MYLPRLILYIELAYTTGQSGLLALARSNAS